MAKTQKEKDSENLIHAIIEGIDRNKGLDIVKIDLRKINHSECNYFIICHGNSNTHVDAIARSVEKTVEELTGEKVWHKDGYQNSLWILLDYADIMVHIFQYEARNFYNLENLWADALVEEVNIENK
ncbi:ribosome silencing factor [Mangrovibacterium marinum]|uniref:Ribosomal silencing factor RsfS n=1 Tax=Mangrovibacterium marinum TaxID=1639118 RepID=A0A2T5C5V8_9BACT|nr:ribosome silencing factor [Mangrovibacterium marinum]PTN10304.1 ribosome-associated protein [Mangrovibacterium marinum]